MNSFILHFRPWFIAALVITLIEGIYYYNARPDALERTNFLQFGFVTPETPQRLFVYHKLLTFVNAEPTIVQAGDSSGFYGIRPLEVMKHLPAGVSYLNLSCCANLGFRGYYNILEFMLRKNKKIKYIVLHFTPYTMPSAPMWDGDGAALWPDPSLKVFGEEVRKEFLSVWRIFHFPTLAKRRWVTDNVFYLNGRLNLLDRPLLNNSNYLKFLEMYEETRGWMPENDHRVYVPPTECQLKAETFFDFWRLGFKTYLEDVLDSYADLARRYGVTLVVVFQPSACKVGTGIGNEVAREVVRRFKENNKDVEIPFDLIESWPYDWFSVPAHVRDEHSVELSARLGRGMSEIIQRRGL